MARIYKFSHGADDHTYIHGDSDAIKSHLRTVVLCIIDRLKQHHDEDSKLLQELTDEWESFLNGVMVVKFDGLEVSWSRYAPDRKVWTVVTV